MGDQSPILCVWQCSLAHLRARIDVSHDRGLLLPRGGRAVAVAGKSRKDLHYHRICGVFCLCFRHPRSLERLLIQDEIWIVHLQDVRSPCLERILRLQHRLERFGKLRRRKIQRRHPHCIGRFLSYRHAMVARHRYHHVR